ncbi:histone-lysine N-methyltransferase SETMAR-like [Solenopsis invicta]|uniref:histone-lysine N-methyltransferase SETMAR-like n=1 Tax=Solenopsis invicta TaxID=13686 RepID=UPI000595E422|nr:histone-lysine N-methyltransferase SETMAR-like [Solenopsis invicta]
MNKSKINVVIEYEFRRGLTAAQTTRNIKNIFGEDAVKEHIVRRYFEKFRSGNFNLENESPRQFESKMNNKLKAVIKADTSQTKHELAARFGVTIPTITNHLKQIGMVQKLNRWVPRELDEQQKRNRLEVCLSLLSRQKGEPFLHRIITYNEKSILLDNRKRTAQLDKDEVPKPNIHQQKLMVSVWWSSDGVIHYNFTKPGESITEDNAYCKQLDKMMKKLAIKQPRLTNRDRPILLQDNDQPRISQTVLLKLQQLDLEILYHPPYSPDLAPTDYHFFRKLDHFLEGQRFNSYEDAVNVFSKIVDTCSAGFFAVGINELPLRWQNCINKFGAYFD